MKGVFDRIKAWLICCGVYKSAAARENIGRRQNLPHTTFRFLKIINVETFFLNGCLKLQRKYNSDLCIGYWIVCRANTYSVSI